MKFVLDTNICIYWLKGNKKIEDKIVGVKKRDNPY